MNHSRRGISAVEFGLTLPVWLLFLMGTMETSWILYQRSSMGLTLNEACRRTALVDPASNDVQTVLEAEFSSALSDYGLPTCSECVVAATVAGTSPDRHLVCQASRTSTPLSGYVFGSETIGVGLSVWMEWQDS